MERAVALELFECVRTNGWQKVRGTTAPSQPPDFKAMFDERVVGSFWRVAWAEQDELFYLETMQQFLDALRSASQHHSWTRLSVEVAKTNRRIQDRLEGLDSFRFIMSGMSFANWQRVFEHVVRQETQRGLIIAAIALQRYHLRHGKFPPDLDSLTPEFLDAVPVDYMDGLPLRYRRNADASFQLYSVGFDGKDDGGNPQPVGSSKTYSGLFDGRDAVWPRLVSSEQQPATTELAILPLVQFANAPVPDVIRVLAREADLQVQMDPKVMLESLPPVTLRLENMTALGVLETILKSNGLVLVKHAGTNLVCITTK